MMSLRDVTFFMSMSLLHVYSGVSHASTAAKEDSVGQRVTGALLFGGLGYGTSWWLYNQSKAPAEALLTIDSQGVQVGKYELVRWTDIRNIFLLKERESGQTKEFIILELNGYSPRTSREDEELSKRLGLRDYEMFISQDDVNDTTNLKNLKETISSILHDNNSSNIQPKTYFGPPPSPAGAYIIGLLTTFIVLTCLFGSRTQSTNTES